MQPQAISFIKFMYQRYLITRPDQNRPLAGVFPMLPSE